MRHHNYHHFPEGAPSLHNMKHLQELFYRPDGGRYSDEENKREQWAIDMERRGKRKWLFWRYPGFIKQEFLKNGLYISTVWLGLDHGHVEGGAPLIYETMVFARGKRWRGVQDGADIDCDRYATIAQAKLGHTLMKQRWQNAQYFIVSDSITCMKCGMTSHNSNDITNLFCGNCDKYHEKNKL